jgi:hypothetical protein
VVPEAHDFQRNLLPIMVEAHVHFNPPTSACANEVSTR